MERIIRISRAVALAAAMSGLAACNGIPGSDSGDPAPPRPLTTVSGRVVDDAIGGALINVYAFDGGRRGELLASTTSAADGGYSVAIDGVTGRPLLLEARGGRYVELATGRAVELESDQVLKAVAVSRPGQPLTVMVTPLTHLVTALTEYRLATGMAVAEAIAGAAAEVNALFGIDVTGVAPRSIAEQGASELTPDYLYGFFLSALSSWTKRVGEQNGHAPHAVYTSIALSQLLYEEVAADGLLDGKAGAELALGVVGLGPNTYRISLAQHMLAMAAGDANLSGVSVEQLLPLAYQLVFSEHRLFAGVAPELSGDPVAVSTEENLGAYRSGVFQYAVTLGSPELISSVRFSVDDFELPVAMVPGDMRVPIDSRQFPDGEHTVSMRALDWLGNTVASVATGFRFDNTAPYVNITSTRYTNAPDYLLSGEVGDNGSGLLRFEIDGQAIGVRDDNSWSLPVSLDDGNNALSIRLEDGAGNVFVEQVNIALDRSAPRIDTAAGHSRVRFMEAGQVVEGALADVNDAAPLYLETRKADLKGTPIVRAALAAAGIPYFAFKASDPVVNGIATAPADLSVRMRYEKNGTPLADWRRLTPVAGEYLVPLAGETLHNDWHRSLPGDEHGIRIEVVDAAGNRAETLFSFRTAFVVAGIEVSRVRDLNGALFNSTPFARRAELHDREFAALAYTFTNDSGQAIYVQPGDGGGHLARREVERLVREHKVRQTATPMWRVAVIENVSDLCIGSLVNKRFAEVTEIYNFDGSDWVRVTAPPATVGEPLDVFSDTPAPPEDSEREDVDLAALFDAVYAFSESSSRDPFAITTTRYEFDYLLNVGTTQGISQPVLVRNWERLVDYKNPTTDDEQIACDVVPYFKQFERYSYVSEPGYPRNSRSLEEDQQPITVAGYTLRDETASADIDAVSGWYRIPAGHSVTITKHMRTPDLAVDDEVAVTDGNTNPGYTPLRYDKAIHWSVNRALTITAVHDAGADNIFAMTPTTSGAGTGAVEYSVSR